MPHKDKPYPQNTEQYNKIYETDFLTTFKPSMG